MDYEKNIQPVPDEERRRAEAKQVTLQPLHDDVTPDPRPDAEIVANHMTGPPIANASNDTEQTKSFVQPSREVTEQAIPERRENTELTRKTLVAVVIIITVAGAYFVPSLFR